MNPKTVLYATTVDLKYFDQADEKIYKCLTNKIQSLSIKKEMFLAAKQIILGDIFRPLKLGIFSILSHGAKTRI